LAAAVGFVFLTVVRVIAYASAPAIVGLFVTGDPAVVAEGATFVRTTAPAWGFIALQLTIVSTFQASGNMLAAMVLALVSQWVLQFPLAFALSQPHVLGTGGLWWSFSVTNVLTAVVACLWFMKGDWRSTRLTESTKANEILTEEIMTSEGLPRA
jgi:Na+-driven multidrug efflux pump